MNRYRAEGWSGLQDRSSSPRRWPTRTPAAVERRVLKARLTLRTGPDTLAEHTGVPARTISRILSRHQVPPLSACDPLTGQVIRATRAGSRRYEHRRPGDMIHVDVKKLGKIPAGGGHRAHGRGERPGALRGLGHDYIHAVADDHSHLACAEILRDEKDATRARFLTRGAAFFQAHGITRIERIMTATPRSGFHRSGWRLRPVQKFLVGDAAAGGSGHGDLRAVPDA